MEIPAVIKEMMLSAGDEVSIHISVTQILLCS